MVPNRKDQMAGDSKSRFTLAAALSALAITLAACGSSSPTAAGPGPTPSAGSPAPVQISTTTGPLGTYLVDGTGRSLYLYDADPQGGSQCYNACASQWPAVPGPAEAGTDVTARDLTSATRTDGIVQAVYNEHALYYFVDDLEAGQTAGQAYFLTGGGYFYLVAPDGSAIETTGAASASASSGAVTSSSAVTSSGG